ncbi:HAMP domain-containing sensor histidine kinase [Paenibacillus filicis]|uniref:histidine kinase n=1 Tax=Paenibacillus filicis TaxID=669464 RepID=A0ABU9DRX4_9BACL
MIKRIKPMLNWRRSIRFRLFVMIIASLVSALLLSSLTDTLLKLVMVPSPDNSISFTVFIGSFVFFVFFFLRPIVRQLRLLSEGLMTIAGGDLNYRLALSSEDELGGVAHHINYMAEQLQQLMERERRIEMSKMELITSVSHDLRTPLTSIIGYLNLLRSDDYRDLTEHKRYIDNTWNKTQQLKRLIDDLFEYTRLTSGDATFVLTKVDLSGLLEQLIHEFEPIAHDASLKIRYVREPDAVFAHIEAEKLVRAIDNLLVNALKFSNKPGEIVVTLAASGTHLQLVVENDGKPITREQELLLFERFYKGEASRSEPGSLPGAGLGLAIARNIVERHGGSLTLLQAEGHYTFTIELPKPNRQLDL